MSAYQIFKAVMDVLIIMYGIVTIMIGTVFCTWLWIHRVALLNLYQWLQSAFDVLGGIKSITLEHKGQSIKYDIGKESDDNGNN